MTKGEEFDVAVIGSGAAGLSAAVFAALDGAKVILIERTEYLGGTTAFSAGTTWAPNTRLMSQIGAEDSRDNVLGFLDRAVGNRSPRAMREAFVDNAPKAIHRLMDKTVAQFRIRPFHPDYLHELEGSTSCGRALEPEPFRASALGRDLALIRPAIPEFTILGGLQVDRDDINHLLSMGKSPKSLAYAVKLIGTYALDKLRFGRSARLVMGNALIGRLLLAARELGVEIRTKTNVTDIVQAGEGSTLEIEGGAPVLVRGGVILATGGFSRHPTRRAEMLPTPVAEVSPSAPGHTGAMHDIVLKLGARYGEGAASNVFWAPVSKKRRADGTTAVFPHFVFDRSKPGVIAVGKDGKRFTNESRSYHEFGLAQYATGTVPAYLITGETGLQAYGLGMVRPGGMGAKALIKEGYLTTAPSLTALAGKLGIDAKGLEETAKRMARFAETGKDDDFHRGETVYERANGDASHGPNPTLGALGPGPYYAVSISPGDIGAATGLLTDETARLLDQDNQPIPGLYACGNDMQSIMGGVYPGPGITIGPAITFAFIAAQDAAARAKRAA
jgi:succinate dehydrogenase/fumarate reductase flavoprotein subunit